MPSSQTAESALGGAPHEERTPHYQEEVFLDAGEREEWEKLIGLRVGFRKELAKTNDPEEKIQLLEEIKRINQQLLDIGKHIEKRFEAREQSEFGEGIRQEEIDAWKRVLGTETEVPSPPEWLDQKTRENLKHLGFEIHWEPGWTAGLDDFPALRDIEHLSSAELRDPLIPRWLPKKFLDTMANARRLEQRTVLTVKELLKGKRTMQSTREIRKNVLREIGDISEYPHHSEMGNWVAVERIPKPNQGDNYEDTPLEHMMAFTENRFGRFSRDEIQDWIAGHENKVLESAGLTNDRAEIRLLPAISYNLFANRFGWGATNSNEWVSTRGIDAGSGRSFAFAMGHREHGGAGAMLRRGIGDHPPDTGFRLAIYFKKRPELENNSSPKTPKTLFSRMG